jgi:hypothetical protein
MADNAFPTDAQGWAGYQGNPQDPQALAAYVQFLSQQPGADPSLASDPNYWIQKISETGGVSSQTAKGENNTGYWMGRSKAGAGNGGGASPGGANGFQYAPSDFVTGPFGQYALKEAQNATNAHLFARGLGLSTGAAKDIAGATYGALGQLIPQDYAMQQGQFQTNFNNLNTLANFGQNAQNQANQYGTSAAAAGAAGTVGTANAINQGVNNVGNAYQNYTLYKSLNNPPTSQPMGMESDEVNP